MDDDVAAAFAQASQAFTELVSSVPDDDWTRPPLGDWSVLELVAHANRAHTTVEEYVLRPQPVQPSDGPYFSPAAIAQRGRESVAALGDDPAAAVAEASARVVVLVGATDGAAPLGSPAGRFTLAQYLPSRTAELVIHGLDVAAALQRPFASPDASLAGALAFVAARAARGDGTTVLRALTGRGPLPDGFSVY